MKNKIKKAILFSDQYSQKIEMNYKGQTVFPSLQGGCCSLIDWVLIIFIAIYSSQVVIKFKKYDISRGLEFYDVKNTILDVTETVEDFVFTFKHNGQPIDMVDNEYINFKFFHQYAHVPEGQTKTVYENEYMEPKLCSKSHIFDNNGEAHSREKYGNIYCVEHTDDHKLDIQGRSEAGYPLKRFAAYLDYCNQEYLTRINSDKTCKSRDEAFLWVKNLYMSIQYNKPILNMNNLQNVSSVFDTTEGLFRRQNKVLKRETFTNIQPDILYTKYYGIKLNKVVLEDSIFGSFVNPTEIEYQEAEFELEIDQYKPHLNGLFSMLLQVSNTGENVSRKVWNLEDALGWAGGIFGILQLLIKSSIAPFVANNMAIALSASTVLGQKLKISSLQFQTKQALDCKCTQKYLRKSKEYSEQIEYFEEISKKIQQQLEFRLELPGDPQDEGPQALQDIENTTQKLLPEADISFDQRQSSNQRIEMPEINQFHQQGKTQVSVHEHTTSNLGDTSLIINTGGGTQETIQVAELESDRQEHKIPIKTSQNRGIQDFKKVNKQRPEQHRKIKKKGRKK